MAKEKEHFTPGTRLSNGISIKEYFERLFTDNQRAIDKAEALMNQRLEGMNEFREQLKDQASKFITREELAATIRPIQEDVKTLRKLADVAEGKASQNSMLLAALASLIGIALGLINMFVK